MTAFTESIIQDAALAWLEMLGYAVLHGPEIAPDASLCDTLLPKRIAGEIRVRNVDRYDRRDA